MRGKLIALAIACALPLLNGCAPLVVVGAGTGMSLINDRRATATVWTDQQIELRTVDKIHNKFGTATHVNVTSFNKTVLLTGEAPDEATRAEVEKMAQTTPDVKKVFNEVVVAPASGVAARSSDTALTAKVKTGMFEAGKFSPVHVKVVTERSVVYLLGLVKQQEGRDAAEIASKTAGVSRVETFYEYID